MVIECTKGWFADGGSDLPIMVGERFKGEFDNGDIIWVSMKDNLNPGMEFEFVGRQLLEFFRIVYFD
jgi:hypothetical protein